MKFPRLLPISAFAIAFLAASPQASAQARLETAWTSNDGVTIWARLVGWDGNHFLLKRGGRDYRVPPGRLTADSREKARKMLDLDPAKLPPVFARREPAPAASRTAARPPETNRVAAISRTAETVPDLSTMAAMAAAAALPLPDADEPATEADARFGALLPSRDEIPETTDLLPSRRPLPVEPGLSRPAAAGGPIRLEGRRATAPAAAPSVVRAAIEAANRLQDKPYKWGGGHGRVEDSGYDCSGSVSYVLMKAGLLRSPGTSRSLMNYGHPGPGRWITIHARNGHAFMTICGLRLDTGGSGGRGESGPRWRPAPRGAAGFVMRHPPGF